MAGSLLVFGLLAITSTTLGVTRLSETNRERRLAEDMLRTTMESVRALSRMAQAEGEGWSASLAETFRDEPEGLGLAVSGLQSVEGEPLLSIQVVTDETLSDEDLGVDLGLPRDLNGNSQADDGDVSASALLLPVVVRIRWAGSGGTRQIVHGFFVTRL